MVFQVFCGKKTNITKFIRKRVLPGVSLKVYDRVLQKVNVNQMYTTINHVGLKGSWKNRQ